MDLRALVSFSGKSPLGPCNQGFYPFFLLLDSVYLALYRGPWYIWTWASYKEIKNGSICNLLHANCLLNQHHLLKMFFFFFFTLNGFIFFIKDQVTTGVWVHFSVFNSIPLYSILFYLPVSVPNNFFFFLIFLLGIFLIYISNAIPKVPHTTHPQFPTHPLPLFGPGVPLYWGI